MTKTSSARNRAPSVISVPKIHIIRDIPLSLKEIGKERRGYPFQQQPPRDYTRQAGYARIAQVAQINPDREDNRYQRLLTAQRENYPGNIIPYKSTNSPHYAEQSGRYAA